MGMTIRKLKMLCLNWNWEEYEEGTMVYIDKKDVPEAMRKEVARIKSAPEWKKIHNGDTKAIRTQFDCLPKKEIREALLGEQHHLCAYCMKRIRNEELHMTIEHWFPLSLDKNRALDYHNLLGVCKGGGDIDKPGEKILCCDASKGNKNEMVLDPQNNQMMERIAYYKDGIIYFNRAGWDERTADNIDHDINKILCLNGKRDHTGEVLEDTATGLIKGRRDTYKKYQTMIKTFIKKGELTSAKIRKEIERRQRAEVMEEFDGVLLFFLKRKYKVLVSQGK